MAFTTPSGVADSGVAFSDVNNINFLDTNTSQDTEPTSANSDLDSIEEDVGKTEDRYGRPYYPGEAYRCPADDQEKARLKLQFKLFLEVLGGQYLEQIGQPADKSLARVLDIGTGTGEWAIHFAHNHPDTEVIGVDLRPIQPVMIPPNCSFEIDDCERPWNWRHLFRYIHMVGTIGCIKDCSSLFEQVFNNLEPGGGFQAMDFYPMPYLNNGTVPEDDPLLRLCRRYEEATKRLGRPIEAVLHYKEMMMRAGFTNVRVTTYDVPANPWPQDIGQKSLGSRMEKGIFRDLEGLFKHTLVMAGENPEKVDADCVTARESLKDQKSTGTLPYTMFVVRNR